MFFLFELIAKLFYGSDVVDDFDKQRKRTRPRPSPRRRKK
jgi:hypothetical protein